MKALPEEVNEIHYAEVIDDWLQQRLQQAGKQNNTALVAYRTPCFLNSRKEIDDYLQNTRPTFKPIFTFTSAGNGAYYWRRMVTRLAVDGHTIPRTG